MLHVARPDKHVALIRLGRPEKLHALTLESLDALDRALTDLDDDPEVRAIVVTGSTRAFSAGLDLDELAPDGAPRSFDAIAGMQLQERAAAGLTRPRRCRTPVVAAIDGLALGGGLALALSCDLRVCSEGAKFVPGFQRLGLTGTDVGVSWLLPRLVGASVAFDLMLTSRTLDAQEARRHGLVSRVVPTEAVDAGVEAANEIAAHAPYAMRLTKEAMWANLGQPDFTAALALENRNQVLALQTEDHREGLTAILERRPATFTGT